MQYATSGDASAYFFKEITREDNATRIIENSEMGRELFDFQQSSGTPHNDQQYFATVTLPYIPISSAMKSSSNFSPV
jgi:hypothetical protein